MVKNFFVLAAVFLSIQLSAQDSVKVLDEAVVTANKYVQKQSQTGKVLIVINREQLEKSHGSTLSELLNTVAGTNVIGTNNVLGTNQTISIRGAAAGNVLLLIDGIPVNDPSAISNYFDLNFLNIDQVERIEILKGGQSTLYGSDAVAGVVNIILKKGADKFNVYGDFAGGSYHTLKESIGFGGQKKKTDYSVNYTHISSDGFSAAHDKNKTGTFDKDGYDQHAVNARLGFGIGKKLKASVNGSYSNYKADLDAAAFTDERDYTVKNDNKQAGATFIYPFKKGNVQLHYNFNRVERKYLDDSTYKPNPYAIFSNGTYTGRTHFAELYGHWQFDHWEVLAGGDYRFNNTDQWFFSTGLFGPFYTSLKAEMKQVSPYASVSYKNEEGFGIELGGRFNHHSEYGSNFTFTLNPFYLIQDKWKLFANFYSAYKVPTLYQLFDEFAGNSKLTPEKGMIGEAGAEILSVKNLRARVVGFYRNTKDAILYTYDPNTYTSQYKNVSKQTNYGGELEASYKVKKVSISANYTYTTGKTVAAYDGTGSPTSKDTSYYNLYRIPKHAINVSLGVQSTDKFYYSILIHSVSKREEFIFGAVPEVMKAYMTIDLYGEYRFDKRIKIFLDLKNFNNNEHVDILGYNSKKSNVMLGVNFQL